MRSLAFLLLLLAGCPFAYKPRIPDGFFITRDGVKLYYFDTGGRGPTVLIPGAAWLVDDLRALAGGRRLIFYDTRSRGLSQRITDPNRLGFEVEVRDLEAVREFFELETFSLLGWGYHGLVVAKYASIYPDYVDRVLLVDPALPRMPEGLEKMPASTDLLHPEIEWLQKMRQDGVDQADPPRFARAFWMKYWLAIQMSKPEVLRFMKADPFSFSNEAPDHAFKIVLDHIFPSLGRWDFRPLLRQLEQPLLVIHGKRDGKNIEAMQEWPQEARQGRMLFMEAGHFPWLEDPDTFFDVAGDFLDGEWPEGSQ